MIRYEQVRFSYEPGESPDVVAGVDLVIDDGQYVALLGRNGSGKSTLARLTNGLLTPTHGRVVVDGTVVESDPWEIRQSVQLVFQNPENQQVGLTAYEDIAFGLANFGVPTSQMRALAEKFLAQAGLDIDLDRPIHTLSGGELQRLALASVLALEPRHLILDEATSMLDARSASEVRHRLRGLHADEGTTIVEVTHDLRGMETVDRMVLLDYGRIVADDEPSAILRDTELMESCGLEPPYRWRRARRRASPSPARLHSAPTARLVSASVDYSMLNSRGRVIRRRRPSGQRALDSVDFAVAPGELVGVAGPSGAGKSTLVSVLCGLAQPTGGEVQVGGVDAWKPRRARAFDQIGFVFQHPEHQLFASTVARDVAYGLMARKLDPEEIERRTSAALERLGLNPAEVGDRSPFELSGGQQRRVAIAGVMVNEPHTLVLDEPTAGMDLPAREALFEMLEALRAQGVGVVWISHRLEEIVARADRVVVIDDGRVVAEGMPLDVLSDPALLAGLGWPLIEELDPAVHEGDRLGDVAER